MAAQNKKTKKKSARTNTKNILSGTTDLNVRFVPNYQDLKKVVRAFKKEGRRVVLTQGVWDLIHEGHATYLEKARSLGDILIVGVDSDELTRKRKGPNRPIVPQKERLKMLVHLRHVDIVTIREVHHDIGDLIRLVSPDVLVVSKSTNDFTDEMVKAYAPYCGRILSLPPQATSTTTGRIRQLTIEGAETLAREITQLTKDFIAKIRQV